MGIVSGVNKKIMIALFLLGGAAWVSKLWAQTIETGVIQKASETQDQFIIQDQNRLKFEASERAANRKKSPPIIYEKPVTPSVVEGELPAFFLSRIEVKGVTLLTESSQKKLISSYQNRKVTLNDINQLAAAITNAYLLLGYVTARTYLPKQSLKEGLLILQVQEGFIEEIQAEGLSPWQKELVFLGKEKSLLNIWDLEEALDQLNRLSSAQTTLQLLPSPLTTGGTIVQIQTQPGRLGTASLRYDNLTDPQLQVAPNSVELSGENIIGSLDQWNVSYYQKFKDNTQFQNSMSANFSFPVGSFTPKASYSQFNYATLVSGTLREIMTSGQTSTVKAGVDILMWRDSKNKETMTLELTSKGDNNYIEDTKIEANSSQLTTFSAALNHTWYAALGTFTWGITYVKGLTKLGATLDDSGLDPSSPHAQFQKIYGELSGSVPIQTMIPVTLQGRLSGQYSDKTLYASERLSVGDFYSIPGYDSSFSGDLGATGSLKMSYVLGMLSRNFTMTHGISGGFAWKKGLWNEGEKAYMTSITTGLSYREDCWVVDLTLAKAIYASESIEKPEVKLYASVTRCF